MDLDGLEALLRKMQSKDVKIQFELWEFNTHIVGSVAYSSYRARNAVSGNEYIDSAVLRRMASDWLLERVHITRIKRAEP